MNKKLVMVSLRARGRRIVRFVMAEFIDGKARVKESLFAEMAEEAGCRYGQTYTFGG